jgi:hypothetical protein
MGLELQLQSEVGALPEQPERNATWHCIVHKLRTWVATADGTLVRPHLILVRGGGLPRMPYQPPASRSGTTRLIIFALRCAAAYSTRSGATAWEIPRRQCRCPASAAVNTRVSSARSGELLAFPTQPPYTPTAHY